MVTAESLKRGDVLLVEVDYGFDFEVTVADLRNSYGRIDALVRPVAGTGERWIRATKLKPLPVPAP